MRNALENYVNAVRSTSCATDAEKAFMHGDTKMVRDIQVRDAQNADGVRVLKTYKHVRVDCTYNNRQNKNYGVNT